MVVLVAVAVVVVVEEVVAVFLGFNHVTFCLKFRFPDGGYAK